MYICAARNEPAARAAFTAENLVVRYARGARYMGGFIGSPSALKGWIKPKVEEWCESVKIMEDIARRYPQAAHYGLTTSLQNEWQHVCQTVPGAGAYMDPLEAVLSSFLSSLLDAPLDEDGKLRTLLGHKVKQAGMGIPNPTAAADRAYEASRDASGNLIAALKQQLDIDVTEHKRQVARACKKARSDREDPERAECTQRCK